MSTAMTLSDVSVVFRLESGDRRVALENVSMSVEDGEFIVVVGPNGAGKSTLVNAIAGSVPLAGGTVRIDGTDASGMPEHQRSRGIGRVRQDPNESAVAELTIAENLALAATRSRRRSPFRLAVTAERRDRYHQVLADYERGLEGRLDRPVSELSGGQRQLLALVMAVIDKPSVLLLDEHTSALDPEMADYVMKKTDRLVRELGISTVMITHNMRQAQEYGDRLLILDLGHIVGEIGKDDKTDLTEERLIEYFRSVAKTGVTDRILGG